MAATNESTVFTGLSGLLRNHVLTPIASYLATRQPMQGNVTVDELANVLRLPSSTPAPPAQQFGQPPVQSFGQQPQAFGQQAPPFGQQPQAFGQQPFGMQPATATPNIFGLGMLGGVQPTPKGKAKAPAEPVPFNERCQYQIQRGQNSGKQCEKRAMVGQPFCTTCSGKKSAQTQITKAGGMPQVGGIAPGYQQNGMPPMNMNPAMGAALTTTQSAAPQLQVTSIGNGQYFDPRHGLLLRNGNTPGEIICTGTWDNATKQSFPLTPEKIQLCQTLGINYVDPNKQNGNQVSALPSYSANGSFPSALPQQQPISLPGLGQQQTPPTQLPGQFPQGLPSAQQLPGQFNAPAGFPQGLPSAQQFPGQQQNQQFPGQFPTQQLPGQNQQLGGQQLPGQFPTQQLPGQNQQLGGQQLPSQFPTQQLPGQFQVPAGLPQAQPTVTIPQAQQLPGQAPIGLPGAQQFNPQNGTPQVSTIGGPSVTDQANASDPVDDDDDGDDDGDDENN